MPGMQASQAREPLGDSAKIREGSNHGDAFESDAMQVRKEGGNPFPWKHVEMSDTDSPVRTFPHRGEWGGLRYA